jgi:hypothetical protein
MGESARNEKDPGVVKFEGGGALCSMAKPCVTRKEEREDVYSSARSPEAG